MAAESELIALIWPSMLAASWFNAAFESSLGLDAEAEVVVAVVMVDVGDVIACVVEVGVITAAGDEPLWLATYHQIRPPTTSTATTTQRIT